MLPQQRQELLLSSARNKILLALEVLGLDRLSSIIFARSNEVVDLLRTEV